MTVGNVAWTSSIIHNSHAHVNGHIVTVANPGGRFAVVPPLPGGCGSVELVRDTAARYNPTCKLAVNGGYYRILTDNGCIGNVVTDSRVIQTGNFSQRNVNFGIRNGEWIVGYITPEEVQQGGFEQLIEGLGWIVHEGRNYVTQGWEEAWTGAGAGGADYARKTSGRVAVGYNAAGELLILHVDGHTGPPSWGATMGGLADKMIELGAIEAINLDGGGSVTMIQNGVQMGYSSDRATYGNHSVYDPACPIGHGKGNNSRFECTRAVSTILCVHEVAPDPAELGSLSFWTPELVVGVLTAAAFGALVSQARLASNAGCARKAIFALSLAATMQTTLLALGSFKLCSAAGAEDTFVFILELFLLLGIGAGAYLVQSSLANDPSAWRGWKDTSYFQATACLAVAGLLMAGVELFVTFNGVSAGSKTLFKILLALSQFLTGVFVGTIVPGNLMLVERLFPAEKRMTVMLKFAFWCMVGLGLGPVLAVAVRMMKPADVVSASDIDGRVGPVQIMAAIGCMVVLSCSFPDLPNAPDYTNHGEPLMDERASALKIEAGEDGSESG